MTNPKTHPMTVAQAAEQSVPLARLLALARESAERLEAVRPLLPPGLGPLVQAGPIEDSTWCLLVSGNAAAAKLRQLLPLLQAHLADRGWQVTAIRLKVQSAQT